MSYNFNDIEAKWQKFWKENKTFEAQNPKPGEKGKKEPFYVLDMFPYPSGAGLHVGHPLGYIASDIMTRFMRHKGYNVLHPMGYDSFGLPAEQYAIQTGQHPAITTETNINRYREQLDKIGFSFDWSREVRTSDPKYYRWTQWIFIQLFESWYDHKEDKAKPISELIEIFENQGNIEVNAASDQTEVFSADDWKEYSHNKQQEILLRYRLTYLADTEVNWCPGLGTVLANDEIINGVSERGGYPVERKKMKQWNMRITAYAERLLNGLDTIDWTDSLKESQRNWIGKSKGTQINFHLLTQSKPEKGSKQKDQNGNEQYIPEVTSENAHLYKKAEECRQNPTKTEATLWARLKDNNLGYEFKQHGIIDDFIVNFVAPAKKLVIEIDAKDYKKSEEYNDKRTQILNDKGYTVLHFTEKEIFNEIEPILKEIKEFLVRDDEDQIIQVFTTRPDTIFGVSFMVLAPEHELVSQITTSGQKNAVKRYIKKSSKRSERERMADKSISGVFTGGYVEHPFTKEPIPIWISDYVLSSYGTGAVMAVPAGDERDYRFAKHFEIPIPNIFKDIDISEEAYSEKSEVQLTNSDFIDGLSFKKAIRQVNKAIINGGYGRVQTNYRLRDAVFSRQRYWGEPFPIYYKDRIPHTIPQECLPLRLPDVEKYLPTEEGNPPLGRANTWHWDEKNKEVVSVKRNETLPQDIYKLELNTMPGWAGSSWYFFRYMEKENRDKAFASPESLNYWKDVDLYIGGSEHATGHLLYSRFWAKFLKDRGYSPVEEPFKKLINQGMILGESALVYRLKGENKLVSAHQVKNQNVDPIHADVSLVSASNALDIEGFKKWRPDFKDAKFITEEGGEFIVDREVEKMSKSKYNVVNPDDICEEYGADSLRLYEMFLGPLDQEKPWSTAGLSGVYSFLKKLWNLYHTTSNSSEGFNVSDKKASKESLKTLHKTIKKVTEDIETFSYNTAVSNFMICVNELNQQKCNSREVLEPLVVLLSPYAPHIAEELWGKLGHSKSISTAAYPIYDESLTKETTKTYPISFNGKKRYTLDLSLDLSKEEIEEIVMADDRTKKQLNGREPKRVIIVPGKIVNIVG